MSSPLSRFSSRKWLAQVPLLRRFAREEKGAAAIEFAMVAAPFFAMLFAILESGLVMLGGQTLETAVADTSRLILTGQAQTGNFDAAKFKTELCSRVHGLFDCAGGIQIDVRTASSFAGADTSTPLQNGQIPPDFGSYNPGGPGDIVVVRAVYQWPVLVSALGFDLINMTGSSRLIMATAAFRNEPYK